MSSTYHTQKTFDHQAKNYDDDMIVRHFQRPIQKLVINKCDIRPGMRILDVGCGTGRGVIDMSHLTGNKGYVLGLDLSNKMADEAQKNINKKDIKNAHIKQGEIFDIHKEKFDLIVTTNTFHHVQDKQARIKIIPIAAELRGILRRLDKARLFSFAPMRKIGDGRIL